MYCNKKEKKKKKYCRKIYTLYIFYLLSLFLSLFALYGSCLVSVSGFCMVSERRKGLLYISFQHNITNALHFWTHYIY